MTRLQWDVLGERFFEAGVDRGVLYIDAIGYAWPGLISVNESSSGGDAKPYYIDGYKYANVAAAEEFEATIQAFSSPPEFAICDGVGLIYNGLFATQQRRQPFSFSYRTLVGNDMEGTDHGYKIHLVYNALSAPSARNNNTLSDSVSVGTLSWAITTLAPAVIGIRPTAHFIIDSRYTDSDTLATIEDVLYGSDDYASTIPTVSELTAMFGEPIYDAGFPLISLTSTMLDGGPP